MSPPFPQRVRRVLGALRPGEVVSYGEVAARAGNPGAHRAVGTLLAAGGLPSWWRVVRSDGRLAAPDAARQADLLRAEGVAVAGGRVRRVGLAAGLVDGPPA